MRVSSSRPAVLSVTLLAAVLTAAQPAMAQSFLDKLFNRQPDPAPMPAPPQAAPEEEAPQEATPNPAKPRPAARRTTPKPAPASAPVPDADGTQAPAPVAAAPAVARAPLPPRRPANLGANLAEPAAIAAAASPSTPATPAKATPVSAPASLSPPADARSAVDRANAYFNNFIALSGDFAQSSRGQRVTGQVYVQKPGRLRFDYDKPSSLLIIADGSNVAIRDTRLNTQDLYPLSQTPLKFLLSANIDLARDLKVNDVVINSDMVRIQVSDTTAFGGTSIILLQFDPKMEGLKQWTVIDAQGTQTTVALSDIKFGRSVDPALFRIDAQRLLNR